MASAPATVTLPVSRVFCRSSGAARLITWSRTVTAPAGSLAQLAVSVHSSLPLLSLPPLPGRRLSPASVSAALCPGSSVTLRTGASVPERLTSAPRGVRVKFWGLLPRLIRVCSKLARPPAGTSTLSPSGLRPGAQTAWTVMLTRLLSTVPMPDSNTAVLLMTVPAGVCVDT